MTELGRNEMAQAEGGLSEKTKSHYNREYDVQSFV